MYAIVGITGQVGGAAARSLLKQGKQVRAIVREAEKGAAWKAQGADISVASIEDASELERAFCKMEGAFIMTPPFYQSDDPRGENQLAAASICHALRACHVPKVVLLSSIGAQLAEGTGAILKNHDIERSLMTSGPAVASIRAAAFMENFAGSFEHAKATGKLPYVLDPLDRKAPMVATSDIGETAAKLLTEEWTGKRYIELEGPQQYSMRDVAAVFSKLLGREVVPEIVPREARKAMYEGFGFTPRSAATMVEMADAMNNGTIAFTGSVEHSKGSTTLEQVYAGR